MGFGHILYLRGPSMSRFAAFAFVTMMVIAIYRSC